MINIGSETPGPKFEKLIARGTPEVVPGGSRPLNFEFEAVWGQPKKDGCRLREDRCPLAGWYIVESYQVQGFRNFARIVFQGVGNKGKL